MGKSDQITFSVLESSKFQLDKDIYIYDFPI